MEKLRGFSSRVSKNALRIGNSLGIFKKLSDLQKHKLIHEFKTFFDVNKVGTLEWKDFDLLRQNICEMSGWNEGTEKHTRTNELFVELWRKMSTGDAIPEKEEVKSQNEADAQIEVKEPEVAENEIKQENETQEYEVLEENQVEEDTEVKVENQIQENEIQDGEVKIENDVEVQQESTEKVVSSDEWIEIWERFHKDGMKKDENDGHLILPDWIERYIEFKFNLLDRAGDGFIDAEEFEYVLEDFGISCKEARTCFMLITVNYQKKIDKEYFKELSLEYYRATDPAALGNFISGKVDFSEL